MATSESNDDDLRNKTQRSPLASQRAKEEGQPQTGRFSQWFPLGAKEGFNQWWAGTSPMATEHKVLSFIPYLQRPPTQTESGRTPAAGDPSSESNAPPRHSEEHVTTTTTTDPYGPRRWNSEMVELSGRGRALNEFSVERIGEGVENNLVMLHGYGAGLGFFYKNFEAISRAQGWKVYALDLLGMGRSSRPNFRIHAKDKQGKITEAENWFIDALEEWRIKRGLEQFTLLGHSLGGYLAVAYALKYPGRLNKLILASPVGIPEDPYAVDEEMPDVDGPAMANEFAQDATEVTGGVQTKTGDNNNFLNQRKKGDEPAPKEGPRRRLPGWLTYLWEANMISPFSLVRWGGPIGPRLVSGWTSRRFAHLPEDEAQALHDYSYSLFRQRGSSEYALAYLLAPGAFARSPLIRRIQGVGRQWIQAHEGPTVDGDAPNRCNPKAPLSATQSRHAREGQRESGIPIVFMYGDHDWMDVAGGFASEEKIKQERARILANATAEERQRDQGSAKVVIINKAGHHVYLDGWEQFNRVMLEEMGEVERRGRRQEN